MSMFSLNTLFFVLWIIPMSYGFYKYCRSTDFADISLGHFLLASFALYSCGYITVAMIFGVDHLLLLPFFGIQVLIRWYEISPIAFIISAITPFLFLFSIYYLLIKRMRQHLKYLGMLLAFCWIILFLSGGVGFLYLLSRVVF